MKKMMPLVVSIGCLALSEPTLAVTVFGPENTNSGDESDLEPIQKRGRLEDDKGKEEEINAAEERLQKKRARANAVHKADQEVFEAVAEIIGELGYDRPKGKFIRRDVRAQVEDLKVVPELLEMIRQTGDIAQLLPEYRKLLAGMPVQANPLLNIVALVKEIVREQVVQRTVQMGLAEQRVATIPLLSANADVDDPFGDLDEHSFDVSAWFGNQFIQ